MNRRVKIAILSWVTIFSLSTHASGNFSSCENSTIQGGVDYWPWFVAKPFPWDNIEGFWQLGDDETSYLSARVLSTTNNRKILSLAIHDQGMCSKPFAKGTGVIDAHEKNVVRALVSDGNYRYQLKMGLFDSRDVDGFVDCQQNIIGVSMKVIGRMKKAKGSASQPPTSPTYNEMKSMVLKKVTVDVHDVCKDQPN